MGLSIYFYKVKNNEQNLDVSFEIETERVKKNFINTINRGIKKLENSDDAEQRSKFMKSLEPFCNEYQIEQIMHLSLEDIKGEWKENAIKYFALPEEVYLKKVNQVYRFFEEKGVVAYGHVYNGFVSKEEIEELIEKGEKVLDYYKEEFKEMSLEYSKHRYENYNYSDSFWELRNGTFADETLPTVGGFFFGNADYNFMYLTDTEEMVRKLKHLIKHLKNGERVFVCFVY